MVLIFRKVSSTDHRDMTPSTDRFVAIVGAPRCGTTSMSDFLKKHGDVSFSAVKEPHFFSQFDLNPCSDSELREKIETEYLARYFPDYPGNGAVLAEASVSYLYRPEQMLPILRMWPEAKFIIAIRDPMELLPSVHRRLLYIGDEVVTDFSRAWSLVGERRKGRNIPRSCVDPRWLYYDEIGRLGKHVENFISVVGRERCFIAVFDDLAADPSAVYRSVLEFVGLPEDDRQDFAPQRPSRGYKSGRLQRLLKRPPKAMRGYLAGQHYRQRVKSLDRPDGIRSRVATAILSARKRVLRWNIADAPPIVVDDAVRKNIRELLKDDVARLSRVIDRDLSHWLGNGRRAKQEQAA
ncbi:MAG: sulfotransferase [Sphingomicrobium sp.]